MSVDKLKLKDAVEKIEDESTSEEVKKQAGEIIEQQTDKLQDEKDLEDLTNQRLETVFVKGEKLQAEPDKKSDDSTPEKEPAEKDDDLDGPTPEETKIEAEEKLDKDDKVSEEGKSKVKEEKKTEVPQLSESYYRAAIHAQWRPEEIKEFYEANPKLAIKTFGGIYESLNRASKDFAALGRVKKEQVVKQPPKPEVKKSEFKGIDVAKLREQYPDDPVVDLVQSIQDQNKVLFEKVQTLEETGSAPVTGQPSSEQKGVSNQEVAAIEQQIETYFRGDELKKYKDFYGEVPVDAVDWNSLTPGQKMNRWTVIEMMDQMIVGAITCGQDMKIDEALRRAHLCVTEPLREQIIRDDIKAKVEKRSSGISLKPSSTGQPEKTKPETKQDLEDATTERLKKVFV